MPTHLSYLRHCAAGAVVFSTAVAAACPKCRVAAGELEETTAQTASTQGSEPRTGPFRGFSFGAGADFPTAYYFRGYLQQDRGVIVQPFFTASADFQFDDDFTISPYFGFTSTFLAVDNVHLNPAHSGGIGRGFKARIIEVPPTPENPETGFEIDLVSAAGDGSGWYEADLYPGFTLVKGDLFVDVNYHFHIFPGNDHDLVQEIGGKISYDVAGFWDPDTRSPARKFSLRPSLTVYYETSDQNGGQETYMEAAIEPTWRFEAFSRRAAVSLPVTLAGSPDGYYVDDDRNSEDLGYASASLKGSISLPIDKKFGDWYLNGSVTYLHLIAEQLQTSNKGDEYEVIGTIGIGVSF